MYDNIRPVDVLLTEASRHPEVSPSAIAKTLYRLNSHKSNFHNFETK